MLARRSGGFSGRAALTALLLGAVTPAAAAPAVDPADTDAAADDDDDDALTDKVTTVKRRIESMIHLGLQERKHVFW